MADYLVNGFDPWFPNTWNLQFKCTKLFWNTI